MTVVATQESQQVSRGMRFFGFCINKLWLLLASVIIIVALAYLALGFLLPKIDRYQTEIVEWVENKYKINIEVDKISAEWVAQGPVIQLSGFKVKSDDGNYDLIQVEKVLLYFDVITSLWDWRFSTQNIVVNKADIKFYINRKLGVALKVQDTDSTPIDLENSSRQLFEILFGQKRITLSDSSLELLTIGGTTFDYYVDKLEVRKFNEIHQLSGQLKYNGGGQITLVSEVYGDPLLENSYSEIYLNGSSVDIANLPWLDSFQFPAPNAGELSWQFWGSWKDKHWHSASGLIALKNASWSELNPKESSRQDKNQLENRLSTMMSWQHDGVKSGFLSVHHFKVKTPAEKVLLLPDFFIKFKSDNIIQASWELVLDDFQIAPLAKYAGYIIDEKNQLSSFLKSSDVSVLVERLNVTLLKRTDLWQPPIIDFKFSSLKYQPWENIPRVSELSGLGQIQKGEGRLHLKANNIELEFGELFRQPLKALTFNSLVNWSYDTQEHLIVNVNNFELVNSDLTINAKAAYFQQDEKPVLSLYTELTNVNAGNKSLYLPVGVMTSDLVNYLDPAVKSGHFPLIKSVVRGPINLFPFANNNGLFVALGFLKNATYQYLPDWPIAKKLDAKLLFEGNSMDITASKAESLNNFVKNARAFSKDLSVSNPILDLELDAVSRNNAGRDFIAKTPIHFISDSLETIDFYGELNSKINMRIGLSDSASSLPKLQGFIDFHPINSKLVTPFITLESIKGRIGFSELGILPSNVIANYRDKELSIALLEKNEERSAALTLNVTGILPAEGISDFLDQQWQTFFDGETSFSSLIEFSLANKPTATRVSFLSDMKGLLVKLPGEFGKTADEVANIDLLIEVDEHSTGEVRWKKLAGSWFWDNDRESHSSIGNSVSYGGDFFLNVEEKQKTMSPGIRIQGNIESTELDDWITFIDSLKENQHNADEIMTPSPELFFESIDVKVDELKTEYTDFKNVNFTSSKLYKKPWSINLESEQGDFAFILNESKPWEISLNNIDIILAERLFEVNESNEKLSSENEQTKEESALVTQKSRLSPLDLVDADIQCTNCIIQEKDYGNASIQIRKNNQGVEFLGLAAKDAGHRMSFFGNWQETEKLEHQTSIQFQLQTNNAGKLLEKWGVDVAIEESSANLTADLVWADSPWNIDFSEVEGGMNLDLGKGYLSEISDEKGRIFSLFNLQSLIRKLTFDFKDVYKKGFFYDSIRGTFEMNEGIISTENVRIDGNVADVRIYGQTDIKNKQVEQRAVITPHLTSSLPVLAAWAIEPTTGVIVYLLNKLMEPAVEVATRIDYRIHGSFDDVKVDEIQTSKEKVKVEYESESKDFYKTNDGSPKKEELIEPQESEPAP